MILSLNFSRLFGSQTDLKKDVDSFGSLGLEETAENAE